MRLAKINLIRKSASTHGTSNSNTTGPLSTDKRPIGAFWYIKEELDDNQARRIAKSKQIDGYRGNIFFGSAEKLWKQSPVQQYSEEAAMGHRGRPYETQPEKYIGRSYGLLSDEDDDEEQVYHEIIRPDRHASSQQSSSSSTTQQDPLSPPLSPIAIQENISEQGPRNRDESTPPMPGSFVFEDDAPVSPAFSSSLTESIQHIPDFFFSTPNRPSYINPGLALEPRYDVASPLPQHARFDMTPRQLAAFSRRKQEFERLMERPSTPSAISDTGTDDWNTSEKERAERERRRKDLRRFRLERQKRLRLEHRPETEEEHGESKKRRRETFEQMDLEPVETSISKRSKSSEIFARALDVEELRESRFVVDPSLRNTIPEKKHSPGPDVMEYTTGPQSGNDPLGIDTMPGSGYSAPTPSPSPSLSPPPPLNPENCNSKQTGSHIPKIPSGLRKAINVSSSPSTSPFKEFRMGNQAASSALKESEIQARAIVDSIPRSSYRYFEFPPLRSSFATEINPALATELSSHFKIIST
ncbi:hypothetical protein H072_2563 [Dactylellina haptotyla CBS 200.50]|uniref:Uncharacterized protein n=1 Tax=Dactylellina haptotyla (strain CBS 200.50) TaxID=1284197 RepID=S8AQV6_DACHA|nr:hypothetical protein H072_2563 [Dactylellina haptotyla CBS 200.50]